MELLSTRALIFLFALKGYSRCLYQIVLYFNIDFPVGVQLQSHHYTRIEPYVFGFVEKILFTKIDLRLSLLAAMEGICIKISKYFVK